MSVVYISWSSHFERFISPSGRVTQPLRTFSAFSKYEMEVFWDACVTYVIHEYLLRLSFVNRADIR